MSWFLFVKCYFVLFLSDMKCTMQIKSIIVIIIIIKKNYRENHIPLLFFLSCYSLSGL